MNKAVFLDRDGTINVEKHYLYKKEDFEFLPGAIEGLKLLQSAGYLLIIITNQSGIARGYYTEEDFKNLNDWMIEKLKQHGINISAVYYCPHHPKAKRLQYMKDCECRKPKLGLFRRAITEFDLEIRECLAVGDKKRDCSICEKSECRGFVIGDNEDSDVIADIKQGNMKNVRYAKDLLEAAREITSQVLRLRKAEHNDGIE